MGKGKIPFIILLVISAGLLSPVIGVFAQSPTLLIGTDPAGDTYPASVDVLNVYFANDATTFQFFINLSATPSTNRGAYYSISLDTKDGGSGGGSSYYWPGSDYYLFYDAGGAFLFGWNGTDWVLAATFLADLTTMPNTLIITGNLSDIGYPWSSQQDMGVIVATGEGNMVKDWAPDNPPPRTYPHYTISYYDVPNLPWLLLPVFLIAMATTISLLYKYRLRPRSFYDEQDQGFRAKS